jgi:hypothetical protein
MAGGVDDELPPAAAQLTRDLIELIAERPGLDLRTVVGALLSVAYAVSLQIYPNDDKSKAIEVLDRHVDFIAGRPIRGTGH